MMRRTRLIRTIAIFLILGAIVNVLVAWGCAVLIDVIGRPGNENAQWYDECIKMSDLDRRCWSLEIFRAAGVVYIESHKDLDPYGPWNRSVTH